MSFSKNSWSQYFDENTFVQEVTKITGHLIRNRYRCLLKWELNEVVNDVMLRVLREKFDPKKGAAVRSWLFSCVVYAVKKTIVYATRNKNRFNRQMKSE